MGIQVNNHKNIEVEIRALVPNFVHLKKTLLKNGATYHDKCSIHDIYFCPKNISTLKDVEMNEVGSYSLRLRKEKKEKNNYYFYLNTKTITNHGDHNAWEEHEISVNNFKETIDIIKNIGFKSFFELQKTRFHYKYSNLSIFLENIKDFGTCIELEKIVRAGEESKAKQEILNFLKLIGITDKQLVAKSVTNMVMKKRAFK